jgi:hypothetical protein
MRAAIVTKTTPPDASHERTVLAEAIAAYSVAEKDHSDAVAASAITSRRMRAVADELTVLRSADDAEQATDDLVAQIVAGADAAVLAPIDRTKELELETAYSRWRRAAEKCAAHQAEARKRLDLIAMRRDAAAKAALTADAEVDRLFAGLDELAEQFAARRAAIIAMARHASPAKENEIKCRLGRITNIDLERHPAAAEWAKALEALKTDAGAELP